MSTVENEKKAGNNERPEQGRGKNLFSDTFYTIATPPGPGGIAEIHVWGESPSLLCDRFFISGSDKKIVETPPGRIIYGHIARDGRLIDEVIVARRENDRIYGTETVELGCHGGDVAAREICAALNSAGAGKVPDREALDKAVSEKRLSTIEAEAISALRRCGSTVVLPVLLSELNFHALEKEASILREEIRRDCESTAGKIEKLLANSGTVPFVEPRKVFIAGYPNVGKSLLFNRFCARDRVIVHDTPGTTRDVIEEEIDIAGLPVRLCDCAGIGESTCGIEKLAEEFALRGIEKADTVLFLFDSSRRVKESERNLYSRLDCGKLIPIINKTDLPEKSAGEPPGHAVAISAATGEGLEKLKKAIREKILDGREMKGFPAVFTGRQERLLMETMQLAGQGEREQAAATIDKLLGGQAENKK